MWGDIVTPDLFAAALRMATPLALAAIGGTICERSGVVNIALEGIMLTGAFFGTVVVLATGSPWLGVLTAILAGVTIAAVHAFASVNLRADQVVSGTAINLLALGVTGFLMEVWYGHPGTTEGIKVLKPIFSFESRAGAVCFRRSGTGSTEFSCPTHPSCTSPSSSLSSRSGRCSARGGG
jgi:ABC-type uncharacterized transport system permease subunit